jgi:hypothetical protein
MPALVNRPFAHVFNFARPTPAPYRNKYGSIVTAPANLPRFDHDSDYARRGLLIEAGAVLEGHDAITVKAGDWEISGKATVFFEFEDDTGIHRRAIYTNDMRATINACLNIAGHLRKIGAVTSYLANLGDDFAGYVQYGNTQWQLGRAIKVSSSAWLGDAAGRIMIESA